MRRPFILILCGTYLPGFKGGGPIQSVAGLVKALSRDFRFGVIASDRDVGDREPYPGVTPGAWTELDGVPVLYVGAGRLSSGTFEQAVKEFNPDILYLNSYFSPRFSILPRLWRRLGRAAGPAAVLAPRGEFSPGALALKWPKKRAYALVDRTLGLSRDILFHASSDEEQGHVREFLGPGTRVMVARNLSARPPIDAGVHAKRRRDKLRLVFLSRIVPKKNLDGALRMLKTVAQPVHFTICGPQEDAGYWQICQSLIDELPANVTTTVTGPVVADEVPAVLAEHDFFFFPTLGENHGHVIAEALAAGTPVITSDQTPWRDLEAAGAGWTLPLDRPDAWTAVLESCATIDNERYARMSAQARDHAAKTLDPEARAEEHRALFRAALQRAPRRTPARSS